MRHRKLWATICILVLLMQLAACATRQFTESEKAYALAVMNQPTNFYLPKNNADEAWGKAQVFVAQYSNMKIQVATDNVLQT